MIALGLIAVIFIAPRGDGYTFLAQGKPGYARTAFRNQLKREPDDLSALIGLGRAELILDQVEAACEHLLEAVQREPDHAVARAWLAEAFLERARGRMALGQYDEPTRYLLLDAVDQARRAARLDTTSPDPCATQVRALLELGELDDAAQALAETARRGAEPLEIQLLEAESACVQALARVDAGDTALDDALARLDSLKEQVPDPARVHRRRGDLLHAFERYDQALEAYGDSLQHNPFQRPCLELLLSYLRVPSLRDAAREVLELVATRARRKASRSDPRPGFHLYCVGQAALLDRDYAAATRSFESAEKRDPTLAVACQLGRGEAAFRDGDYDAATAAYLGAIRGDLASMRVRVHQVGLDVAVATSLTFLSNRAVEGERLAEGRDLLSAVLALTPEDAPLWNNYGFLCRETGEFEESLRAYERLLELVPNNPRYLNDTALILHYHLGRDLARAEALYRRAVEEAERLIAAPSAQDVLKNQARSAAQDARNNLKKLAERGSAPARDGSTGGA